jgi:glycosyltransferase involved in cell wall biosynthesis
METVMLSIISPVYKAEKIVDELINRIIIEAEKITKNFEIILVEDGSPDNSWDRILDNCKKDQRVKGIKLSRNFGQHYAITAGVHNAIGDYIVVMDCDLQDDPIYIKDLYKKALEGYDIVYTVKNKRNHDWLKNITAIIFNRIFNWLIDNKNWKSSAYVGSYSLISKKVAAEYKNYKDYRRHYLMILRWLGFQYSFVNIEHKERYEGKSTYSFSKLINHAIDGITSQSDKLLRLTIVFGFILSFLSILCGLIILISALFNNYQPGWASLSVLILFVAGLIITSIGILGIYIGKIFEQTKGRPLYLVDKRVNL